MQDIVFIAIALVLAITATVLAFVFIVPEKRREKLGAFGKFLHDACTFKFLLVNGVCPKCSAPTDHTAAQE